MKQILKAFFNILTFFMQLIYQKGASLFNGKDGFIFRWGSWVGTSFTVDSKYQTYAFWGEGGVSSHPSPYYEKPCILSLFSLILVTFQVECSFSTFLKRHFKNVCQWCVLPLWTGLHGAT